MLLSYVASFTVGGLGMGLFYLTDLPLALHILATDMAGVSSVMPWYLPVICVISVYLLIKFSLHIIERLTLKRQMLCPVHVIMGSQAVYFNALVDTGHSLKEPISKLPVIIAEFEHIKTVLPDGLKVMFYEKQETDLNTIINVRQEPFHTRLRMIPFQSLGRAHGMLIGFRPDDVRVGESEKPSDAVIGIYNNQLTRDGRYQGLLGPELVAEL
jgi:stage II sporulation protein GA (sporulation sigma-E factor processing peptidase)